MAPDSRPDLLHGLAEIGEHLGLTTRQVKHLVESDSGFPTFKIPGGRVVCALRSKVDRWLADRAEQATVEGQGDA